LINLQQKKKIAEIKKKKCYFCSRINLRRQTAIKKNKKIWVKIFSRAQRLVQLK
jgi:hypothetical protein